MDEQQIFPADHESVVEGPYASHPLLSALPLDVRHQIADQFALNRRIGAIATLRNHVDIGLKEAKDVIDGLGHPENYEESGTSARPVKLASGKIDKGGTTVTFYRDGTFTTMGVFRTSEPDRLVAFSSDIDSMRRKSITGRGAAALATGGMSVLASNNRGVVYVTITGERSGSKTYTTKNPEDKFLSSVRSLQAAADSLLASPPPAAAPSTAFAPSNENSPTTTQPISNMATQLKTLAELHASGALTDDEFAVAKARILT